MTIEVSKIVPVNVELPDPIPRFREYRLTEPLRVRLESQGLVVSPADIEHGYVLLKPPADLEALYEELAYGDVR